MFLFLIIFYFVSLILTSFNRFHVSFFNSGLIGTKYIVRIDIDENRKFY